jgi:copper oxidase (laccase) domain-containing protein
MVAALHGGWRGIFAGIIQVFVSRLGTIGETPSQWVAAIGPAIGPCCYEVTEELCARFETRFPDIPRTTIQPAFRRLDLVSIVNLELRRAGIGTTQIIANALTVPAAIIHRTVSAAIGAETGVRIKSPV